MKRNKNKVILSSIVVLLPMVIGLLIWNQLPKDVATHFSFNGQPDGYSSKEFAVFVLPLIIFVIHLFCIFAVSTDPKSKNINNKMYSIILWICPLVSVFICNCIYGYTLGFIKNIGFITGLLVCLYGINYQKMLLHILVLMDNLMVIHQKNLQYLSYH